MFDYAALDRETEARSDAALIMGLMRRTAEDDLFVLARAALEGAVRNADDLIGLTDQPRRTRAT
ncbi:hypothetical protein SAMN05443247_11576 [Bradyrhizobium erythrophlei]|jgi:hypothetical protein|nr:hypothetical protein SAMN05443247_11576 [Bradyrhizobium erythrophlei]